MRASGVSGELRHGYAVAARLGRWEIDDWRGAFRLRGAVVSADPVWMARRPLTLVLALGPVEWAWRGVDPALGDGTVEIALTGRPDAVGDAKREMVRTA